MHAALIPTKLAPADVRELVEALRAQPVRRPRGRTWGRRGGKWGCRGVPRAMQHAIAEALINREDSYGGIARRSGVSYEQVRSVRRQLERLDLI